jgi:hypothetical protein
MNLHSKGLAPVPDLNDLLNRLNTSSTKVE